MITTLQDLSNSTWGGYSVLDLDLFSNTEHFFLVEYTPYRERNKNPHFGGIVGKLNKLIDLDILLESYKYSIHIIYQESKQKNKLIFNENCIYNMVSLLTYNDTFI